MTAEPRALSLVTDASRMLAEARTLDDIRHVHNLAQRAKDYAKAARLGLDAQNSAGAIRLEAEAKAGELLERMAKDGQRRARADGLSEQVSTASTLPPTLDDIGVTRNESATWQAVAHVPAEERQEYVAEAQQREEEVTRAGLLRHAKAAVDDPLVRATERLRATNPDVAESYRAAEFAKAMKAHGVTQMRLGPDEWAAGLDASDIAVMRAHLVGTSQWLAAWEKALDQPALRVIGGTE